MQAKLDANICQVKLSLLLMRIVLHVGGWGSNSVKRYRTKENELLLNCCCAMFVVENSPLTTSA